MAKKAPWYSIRAKANVNGAAEIFIYGDIGESYWEETISARDFVADLKEIDAAEITIRINSVGGSVPDGVAIYNAIKRHPANITVAIDAMAYSIASLIAMAGDTVEMSDNALMMLHAPWTIAMGNSKSMRETADMLDTWADAMSNSYAAKTGKTKDDILGLIGDGTDHYFTAAEALDYGLVDSVVSAMPIAASANMPSSILDRYKKIPAAIKNSIPSPSRPSGQSHGDSTMTEKQRRAAIRAQFKAHLNKEGIQDLLDSCIDDADLTPEGAQAKLDDALKAIKPPAADTVSGGDADDEVVAKAEARVIAREKSRKEGIKAAFAHVVGKYDGFDAIERECLDDMGCDVQAAKDKILAKMGEGATPVGGTNVIITQGQNSADLKAEMVGSILARAGKADEDTRAKTQGSRYRHLTLMEMAKESLVRAGVDFSGMNKPQIAMAALTQSTSDFPVLLETAMHKSLLDGYNAVTDTWSRFCKTGTVSDFRAHNRYRKGTIGNYQTVLENGEYVNVAIPDGLKETITASDRGLIINLTYQMIVNDDLEAFIGLANDLGRAGKRTVEAAVYALLAENSNLGPTMGDSNPLFDAAHANISTGAALSAAAIDADVVQMGSQQDISGNDFLDLKPAVLLVPLSLRSQARIINNDQYDPDTNKATQKTNPVKDTFSDVIGTARLSGTRRYLFADPNEAPVIEVAFLDGQMEPYIVMEENFSSRGAKYRATLDFGVDAIAWEGAVTNAGA